jgi:isoleucyl-tRNA synthetase
MLLLAAHGDQTDEVAGLVEVVFDGLDLAIVAHPTLTYVAFPNPRDPGEYLIVARDRAESVAAAIGGGDLGRAIEIGPREMAALEGARYRHPFITQDLSGSRPEDVFRLWFADYVTADTGTGLVHTAPGHGADDYAVWLAHGHREIPDTVDPDGAYYPTVPLFAGLKVLETEGKKSGKFGPANPAVMDKLIYAGFGFGAALHMVWYMGTGWPFSILS